MKTNIYSLRDETGLTRYIGKTIKRLSDRLTQHLWVAKNSQKEHHRDNWLRRMMANGQMPAIHLIEITSDDANDREKHWIAFMRKAGFDLVNTTDGGEGVVGLKHSEATKARWSLLRRGKKTGRRIHENARIALIKSNTGKTKSKACREKIARALTGRHLSDEHKKKISNALTGRIMSPEWIKKATDARKGYVPSEEIKQRLRTARLGKKLTPEHKSKIGLAMKARRLTPEHKARIGMANKKRCWEKNQVAAS